MARAFCELNEEGTRICVFFPYDVQVKNAVKAIPGSRFVPKEKAGEDGPHWTVPLDMDSAHQLRAIFGSQLTLGNAVREWGRDAAQRERNLGSLTTADDAELTRVPTVAPVIMRIIDGDPIPEFNLPKKHPLSRQRPPRPYQRADIAMMAMTSALNANQPGTGKTLEVLGALVEASLEDGPHLVAAPRAALVNTWKVEIERILGHPVYTSEDPKERRRQFELGMELATQGQACWLLGIFDDFRLKRAADPERSTPEQMQAATSHLLYARKDHKGRVYHFQSELHREIVRQRWNSWIIDELHKSGLNTADSLFTLGADMVKAERVYPMSGTPMGGKPIKLFPILRRIDPQKFSSKWRWAERWLEVESNGFGKKIGGIKPGLEEEFYKAHSTVMVRRMKREALPGLPPKVIDVVECPMTPKQRKQYEQFERDAEVRITSEEGANDVDSTAARMVVGDCILAEFSRLKQFANGFCVLNERGEVVPTIDSGKLPLLQEKLEEFGIVGVKMRAGKPLKEQDYEPSARAIVASQSKRMVEMVSGWLDGLGIPNAMLTGDTKDSAPIINRFKNTDIEEPFVIVMTTQTGGVSLNLEEASSIHILDESWNPDDDEQLEDRGDRGTRDTPLMCFYYRTTGTVQEYIAKVADGKKITNNNVLDVYRQMHKIQNRAEAGVV